MQQNFKQLIISFEPCLFFSTPWLCRVAYKRHATSKDEIPFTFPKVFSCNLFVICTYDASFFAIRSDKSFKSVIPLFVQASSPLSKIKEKQRIDFLLKLSAKIFLKPTICI